MVDKHETFLDFPRIFRSKKKKEEEKVGGAKSFASHCALIERYEMVPRKELLSHENHLHFNFLPIVGIQEHKNSSA